MLHQNLKLLIQFHFSSLHCENVKSSPGLNLLERLELGHWHENDDGLLSSSTVNLLGCGDIELPKGGLQVAVDLEVQQSLADLLLDLVGLLIVRLDNFTTGQSHASEIINDDVSVAGDGIMENSVLKDINTMLVITISLRCLHGSGGTLLGVFALILSKSLGPALSSPVKNVLAVLVHLELDNHDLAGVDANIDRGAISLLSLNPLDVDSELLSVALDDLAHLLALVVASCNLKLVTIK